MHEQQKSNCIQCIYYSMTFSLQQLLFLITINKNRQLLYAVKVDNLGLPTQIDLVHDIFLRVPDREFITFTLLIYASFSKGCPLKTVAWVILIYSSGVKCCHKKKIIIMF